MKYNTLIINMCEEIVNTRGRVINCGKIDCDDCPFQVVDCRNTSKVLKIAKKVLGGK